MGRNRQVKYSVPAKDRNDILDKCTGSDQRFFTSKAPLAEAASPLVSRFSILIAGFPAGHGKAPSPRASVADLERLNQGGTWTMALSAGHLRGQRRTGDQPKLSPLPVSISPKVNLTCSLTT
jgi:hypothetical protein